MRTVLLYGHLRKQFGKHHVFDVASPMEAVRALSANFRGFRQALMQGSYVVLDGGRDLPLEHLTLQGGGTIKIVPVAAGAFNKPWLNIIVGALLVASMFIPGVGAFLGTQLTGAFVAMGSSLVFGGISQLLARPPELKKDSSEDTSSLGFDGPVNTYGQGAPVPIGYGRLMIGSNVISASIIATATTAETPLQPCGGGFIDGTYIKTSSTAKLVEDFAVDDDVSSYNPEDTNRTATASTVEWSGSSASETRIVHLTFGSSGSVYCAWDTEVYLVDEGTTIQAGEVQAGDKLAKVGTGHLSVSARTDSTGAIVRQVCGNINTGTNWFAEDATGLLFSNYRTQNNDDSQV